MMCQVIEQPAKFLRARATIKPYPDLFIVDEENNKKII